MIYDIQHQPNFDNTHVTRRKNRSRLNQQLSFKSSVDISSTTLQLQEPSHKQCRICLQAEQENYSNPLVAPCKCTGSVKYVHQKCYRKWIQRQYSKKQKKQQKQILQKGIQCQICKQKIHLLFRDKNKCVSCEKLKERYSKNKGLFLLFFFFLLANVGCISYLSVYTAQNVNSFRSSLVTMVLIIACFVFLGVTGLVTTYYFITDFFIDKIWILESYGLKLKNKHRYSKSNSIQIHPLSVQQIIE